MEQELYVKNLPQSCIDCPCFDDCRIQCNITYNDLEYIYKSDKDKGNKDCPLKSLHDHDKELVAKVLKEVEDSFTAYLPLRNRTGAWFYGRLNEILERYQKEFEDGNIDK